MINVEALTVQDIITAYELAGFVNTENYTSVSIRQLKFKRGHLYVENEDIEAIIDNLP